MEIPASATTQAREVSQYTLVDSTQRLVMDEAI